MQTPDEPSPGKAQGGKAELFLALLALGFLILGARVTPFGTPTPDEAREGRIVSIESVDVRDRDGGLAGLGARLMVELRGVQGALEAQGPIARVGEEAIPAARETETIRASLQADLDAALEAERLNPGDVALFAQTGGVWRPVDGRTADDWFPAIVIWALGLGIALAAIVQSRRRAGRKP